jgi:hypothetical protein
VLADQERRRPVAGQAVLDAELAELPAGQPGALEQRPGLVHDHVRQRAVGVQGPDHPQCRAPSQAGQAAGVAVGVDAEPPRSAGLPEPAGAAPADLLAGRDGRTDHGQGRRLYGRAALRNTARDRRHLAAEVDGGRPGVGDPVDLGVQPGGVPAFAAALADGQRDAEGPGRAEHRRTADRQRGDGFHQLVHRGDAQCSDLMR